MFRGLLAVVALLFVATFPATWLLMLFIRNVAPDVGLSHLGTLALGVLVSALLNGSSAPRFVRLD